MRTVRWRYGKRGGLSPQIHETSAAAQRRSLRRKFAPLGTLHDWKGQWRDIFPRLGGQSVRFDPSKPFGPAQQAPLTPEYQKVLEDSMADQTKGGLGNWPGSTCVPHSMPRMTSRTAC